MLEVKDKISGAIAVSPAILYVWTMNRMWIIHGIQITVYRYRIVSSCLFKFFVVAKMNVMCGKCLESFTSPNKRFVLTRECKHLLCEECSGYMTLEKRRCAYCSRSTYIDFISFESHAKNIKEELDNFEDIRRDWHRFWIDDALHYGNQRFYRFFVSQILVFVLSHEILIVYNPTQL